MSNSKLATYTAISPNRNAPRNHKIDTITIHCMAAQWTAKQCANYFSHSDAQASSNYCVGHDGSIALSVPETDRSWCSSSPSNDHRAITIEVASDNKAPYAVKAEAYNALIALLVDICKRNGIKKLIWKNNKSDRLSRIDGANMTVHMDFANKACPGEYLLSRMSKIASEVNERLEGETMAFKDIKNSVHKTAIEWGAKLGLIKGFDDGTFRPDEPVTRGQLMTIIQRYDNYKEGK